jgi:hypothetical protein
MVSDVHVQQRAAKQHPVKQHSVKQHSVKQHSVRQHSVEKQTVKQHSVKQPPSGLDGLSRVRPGLGLSSVCRGSLCLKLVSCAGLLPHGTTQHTAVLAVHACQSAADVDPPLQPTSRSTCTCVALLCVLIPCFVCVVVLCLRLCSLQ